MGVVSLDHSHLEVCRMWALGIYRAPYPEAALPHYWSVDCLGPSQGSHRRLCSPLAASALPRAAGHVSSGERTSGPPALDLGLFSLVKQTGKLIAVET